jgi:hypothetical protein
MGVAAYGDAGFHSGQHQALAITSNGVGPITATTAFAKNEISKLMPKFKTETGREVRDVELPRDVIYVYAEGEKVLEVIPYADMPRIFAVHVYSNKIRNSYGPQVGDPFGKIFPNAVPSDCYGENGGSSVICREPQETRVSYIFQGNWKGKNNLLPAQTVLRQFKLTEIVWSAPSR